MTKPMQISQSEFDYRKRECDGICSLCFEWTLGSVYSDTDSGYCPECDNRTLCGVNAAKNLKIIEVKI